MAAIAPGGASVAFATADGHLEVGRWSDGAPLGINNGLLGASAVAYSADGALFAASTPQGLKVWRLSDGTLVSQVPELANKSPIGLSNDGSVVVGGSPLTVYSSAGGVRQVGGNLGGSAGHAVSPDGSLLAVTFVQSTGSMGFPYRYTNAVLRISDGQLLWSSLAGNAQLGAMPTSLNVFFSRDGTMVAFGGYPNAAFARVVRPSDGTVVSGDLGYAGLFAFTDDGMGILGLGSQSSDSYALYRVSDGMAARTFSAPLNSRVLAAGFSGGTTVLAVVEPISGGNQQLFVDGVLTRNITRVGTQALSLMAMSPDGTRVFTVDLSGGRVWNTATSKVAESTSGASAAVFAPDGRLATCGSGSCSVRSVPGSPGFGLSVEAAAIAFSRDGTLVATGNRDNTATVWSGVDGAMVRSLWNLTSGHTNQLTGVAFSPDGTRIATSARDKTIKLWAVADGSVVRTISTAEEVTTVSFSPDGGWVLGGPRGIWDVASGAAVPSPAGASSGVFSPSSPTLFTGGSAITRFGLPGFTDLGQVPGSAMLPGGVRSLAITANGGMLASMGASAVVRLWCSP